MKPHLCLALPHIGGRGRPPVASRWGPDFTLACFKHLGHAGGHRFRQMKADEVRERLKFRAEIDALRADKIPAPAPAVPSPTLHVFFPERDGIGRMSAHSWRWRASEWGFAGLGRELGEFDLGSEHPRQSALLPLEVGGEILPPNALKSALDLFFPAKGGIGRVHASVFGNANGNEWAWVGRGRDMGEFMPFGETWPRHADLLPLENAGEILPPTPPHAPNAPPNAPAPVPAPENGPQGPFCGCLDMKGMTDREVIDGHKCGRHARGVGCNNHGPLGAPAPAAPKPKTALRAIVPPPNVNIPLGAALDLTQISASPSHNEARKKANESRFFEPLGEGAFRVTFRIIGSDLVVKVATSKDGEKANLDEANRYLGFTDAQKDCVAPVLANDPNGKFVIMPLCKNANNGANRDLRARMEAANLVIWDINGHNCGELNGKQVIYDFGLFVR